MSSCISKVWHTNVKVEEQKRKAIFMNKSRSEYKVGRIDGCLVTEGIRADYFVSGEGKSVLVELKGCNIDHACSQLFAAVEHSNVKPHLEGQIGFVIICSRYPSHSNAVQLAMQKARKAYKAKFFVFTNQRDLEMSMF